MIDTKINDVYDLKNNSTLFKCPHGIYFIERYIINDVYDLQVTSWIGM